MLCKILTTLLLVVVVSTAHAKGPFSAEGLIGELGIDSDTVSFRILGAARLKHTNALPEDARRASREIQWFSVDVIVRIRFPGSSGKGKQEAATAHQQLRKLLDDDKADAIGISIDDPSLTFSSDGDLTKVTGTGFQAHTVHKNIVVN